MAANTDLVTAKKNLAGALGDNMKLYLQLLKSWFKQKTSREDFDHEARKLLTMDSVHLHNQFMLAILNKCHSLGASPTKQSSESTSTSGTVPHSPTKMSKKSKPKKRSHSNSPKVSFNQRFVAVNPLITAPHIPQHTVEPEEKGVGFASRDLTLPDLGLIHVRLLVTAWEYGLEDITEETSQLMMKAIQLQLKNILSAVFARRSGYKVREKRFRYAMGTELPDPNLRNTAFIEDYASHSHATMVTLKGHHTPSIKPTPELGNMMSATELATLSEPKPPTYKVTLLDLYKALQMHKSAIPSHTVYATNMQRISSRMWHPSNEDLEQEVAHRKEIKLKQDLHARQQVAAISLRT